MKTTCKCLLAAALFAFVPFTSGCSDQGVEPEEEIYGDDYDARMEAEINEGEAEEEAEFEDDGEE